MFKQFKCFNQSEFKVCNIFSFRFNNSFSKTPSIMSVSLNKGPIQTVIKIAGLLIKLQKEQMNMDG